jgi:hypothetical protein
MKLPTKNEARHCITSDIFHVTLKNEDERTQIEIIDSYLHNFAAPIVREGKFYCLNCDMEIDSIKEVFGMATAYRWGIVNGEAFCANCNWPARGMHYIKGADGKTLISLNNVFLPYHPDCVEVKDGI